jgi:cytochrome c-type biogenesis protein CcmH
MKIRTLILVLAALGLALAQTPSQLLTPEMKRVGDKLACLCGSCKNTVANCAMLECHYSLPARQKIVKMLAAGVSDQQIIDSFVKEQGLKALAVPPAEGFNLLAWVMPFAAIAGGLALIGVFIRRYRKPAAVPEIDPKLVERYHERMERDLAQLE